MTQLVSMRGYWVAWLLVSGAMALISRLMHTHGLLWYLDGWISVAFWVMAVAMPILSMVWIALVFKLVRWKNPFERNGFIQLISFIGILMTGAVAAVWGVFLPADQCKQRELQEFGVETRAVVLESEWQKTKPSKSSSSRMVCMFRTQYTVQGVDYENIPIDDKVWCDNFRVGDSLRLVYSGRYPHISKLVYE